MAVSEFRKFDRGLWLMGPRERIPRDALRRARGVHPVKTESVRSRPGSTVLHPLNAHSLFRFAGSRYQGSGTEFFKDGASVKSGLNGSRLEAIRMSPIAGGLDHLLVAGGGAPFKVSQTAVVTNWGIATPPDGMTATDIGAGVLSGVYKYQITFRNSVTNHRSNPNPNAVVTANLSSRQIRLDSIPISPDLQVDQREIWRTVSDGTILFLLATISDNITTTFTDNNADSVLQSTQLPLDNSSPDATFDDTAGPHVGRAWWTRNSATGARGRVYFSPAGRPESVSGFIAPTNDDDPMQKLVIWGGGLWGFSQERFFRILGATEPFTSIEIGGVPGTQQPHTVKPTPIGILYQASDGIRVFDGARSRTVGFDSMSALFRGENRENLNAFVGIIAEFARDEYVISDTSQSLALNTVSNTWRDLGLALTAIFFEEDTGKLAASFGGSVFLLEEEGVKDDAGTPVAFEIETPSELLSELQRVTLRRVAIDINTNGEQITPSLILDNSVVALDNIITLSRSTVERPLGKSGRVYGLRLVGSLSDQVEFFGADFSR